MSRTIRITKRELDNMILEHLNKHILNENTANLNTKIRDWYKQEYPTDRLVNEINPSATFKGLNKNLLYTYEYLNIEDSLARERIFEELANILNVDYDVIYNKFIGH